MCFRVQVRTGLDEPTFRFIFVQNTAKRSVLMASRVQGRGE